MNETRLTRRDWIRGAAVLSFAGASPSFLSSRGKGEAAGKQDVINIGSRRELFMDDHLIAEIKGDVRRQLQRPIPKEVVFVADKPWEGNTSGYYTYIQEGGMYRMIYRGWQHDRQKKAVHLRLS